MDAKLINILNQYDFKGNIKEIKPITVGHINDTFVVEYDTSEAQTRQLDYYSSQNVTTSNYSGAIKQNN